MVWLGVVVREHHPLVWWLYFLSFKDYTIPPTPLWSCGLWSESSGLHEGSYRVYSVCRWFITIYPTPLWSGPCGLHEVYGLFIKIFDSL